MDFSELAKSARVVLSTCIVHLAACAWSRVQDAIHPRKHREISRYLPLSGQIFEFIFSLRFVKDHMTVQVEDHEKTSNKISFIVYNKKEHQLLSGMVQTLAGQMNIKKELHLHWNVKICVKISSFVYHL